MSRWRSLLAIFTLSIFLLNNVAKEMHNLSHTHDVPCNSNTAHLHPAKPHCYLCDFTDNTPGYPTFYYPDFCLSELRIPDFLFPEMGVSLREKDFRSLRAPPSLA